MKPILTPITVHTPTEEEAKELLDILHEDGYCWTSGKSLLENSYWHYRKNDTAYLIFSDKKMVDVIIAGVFNSCMLTLAEFKRLYCDFDDTFTDDCKSTVKVEEEPQSQFQVGDKVIVVTTDYNLKDVVGGMGIITEIMPHGYHIKSSTGEWFVKDKDIMPYSVFTKENPKPQFKLGDKVKVLYSPDHQGKISVVESVIRSTTNISPYCYALSGILGTFFEKCLEPYTAPEIKPTEDIETKEKESEGKGDNPQNSQLDLCELLKGHEGEEFFSLAHGDVMLDHVFPTIDSCIAVKKRNGNEERFYRDGRWLRDGIVMLFPSRSLYEQYPLDPYAAWMKWQEGQKKEYGLGVVLQNMNPKNCEVINGRTLLFRNPADRDKCIEEINTIIKKYSEK